MRNMKFLSVVFVVTLFVAMASASWITAFTEIFQTIVDFLTEWGLKEVVDAGLKPKENKVI